MFCIVNLKVKTWLKKKKKKPYQEPQQHWSLVSVQQSLWQARLTRWCFCCPSSCRKQGGINYHLTHDLLLLPLRRAIFALITDDRKLWTLLKPNLFSSCLLFLLKDRANYVRRRAATTTDSEWRAGMTSMRITASPDAHISFWLCSFKVPRLKLPLEWGAKRRSLDGLSNTTNHSWKVIEDGLWVSAGGRAWKDL